MIFIQRSRQNILRSLVKKIVNTTTEFSQIDFLFVHGIIYYI